MISIVRRWLRVDDYRQLLKNTTALGLVQLSNYILPLLTLPYLSRVLGVELFGVVMMGQSLMTILSLITDFGFNLSASKDIAECRDDAKNVSRIASTVFFAKALLLMGVIGIVGIGVLTVPIMQAHALFFMVSTMIIIGNVVFPMFLFQGLEQLSSISGYHFCAKLAFTGILFWVIQSANDYIWVHVLWGGSYVVMGVIAVWMITQRIPFKWVAPPVKDVFNLLKRSREFFLSRLSVALILNSNILVVGVLFSTDQAGLFSGAEKLLFAVTTMYVPLIESLYPYMARTKNKQVIKKVLIGSTIVNAMGCVVAFSVSPWIIPLIFGTEYVGAVPLFQWMLIVALFHLPTSMMGYPLLAALGQEAMANRSVMIAAVVHVVLLSGLWPIMTTPLHVIWVMIVSQLVIFTLRCIAIQRSKILG